MTKHCSYKPLSILMFFVAAVIFVAGCGEKQETPVSSEIEFVTDYDSALVIAQAKNQKILLDFYTDWCYWCKVLDSATYSDPAVIEFSNTMVFAKVNAEVDTNLAKEYAIQGYPTLVLMEADGTEIDRIGGYLPPDEFLEEINNYLQGIGTLADYQRRAESEPSAEVYYALGDKYQGRGMFDKAAEYFGKVYEIDPENVDGHTHDAMLALGEVYSRQEKYDEAIAHYKDMMVKFEGTEAADNAFLSIGEVYLSSEEYEKANAQFDEVIKNLEGTEVAADAMLWKAYVYRSKINDTAAAIAIYEDFLVKFPESPDTSHAQRYIEKLSNPPPPEEEE